MGFIMFDLISIVLDRPISSAEVCGGAGGSNQEVELAAAEKAKLMIEAEMRDIEEEKRRISQLISAVETAAVEIEDIRKRVVTENQQQIVMLAIEIARKILISEIEEGKYDISAMIEKALQASPSRDGATVRLSPTDYATMEELMKSDNYNLTNIQFESDSAILPAQCFVTTSKGIVEYFAEDQLMRISEALGVASSREATTEEDDFSNKKTFNS